MFRDLQRGCLAALTFIVALGQGLAQDRAASEAELGGPDSSWIDLDPLRSRTLDVREDAGLVVGSENLSGFLSRWRLLLQDGRPRPAGESALHILHFGGSHVQAGRMGWAFRRALASDAPGLCVVQGVLSPYRLVGQNGPPETGWNSRSDWTGQRSAHRRQHGEWGLTGLEASADAPDSVRLWCESLHACLDRVDILTRPSEEGRWGVFPSDLDAIADTLVLVPPDSGVAHLQGVRFHHNRADLVYHDLGGNGASTGAWLRHPHLVSQLAKTSGDLAILAWGINDAHMPPSRFDPDAFKARYGQIIDSLRTALPALEILLVTNNDSHYRGQYNPNAARVKTAMLELVEEKGVACWDLFDALGGACSIQALRRAGFAASDHLHFNRSGYTLIGELLYSTLTRVAFQPLVR